jgi:hypothetical protein
MISCNRKDDDPIGGKGGTAVLKLNPSHHAKGIDSSVVYIKYNASDIPTSYDDSMKTVQENGKPIATFSGLKKGKYYLFSKAYDPEMPIDPTAWFNAKGGMSFEITREDSIYNLILPVTEVH